MTLQDFISIVRARLENAKGDDEIWAFAKKAPSDVWTLIQIIEIQAKALEETRKVYSVRARLLILDDCQAAVAEILKKENK